jgi:hypothetical protein
MAFSIADAARPTLLCEATESPRGETMKRNVVVAAFLAAVLLVISLPAHGEQRLLWSQHNLESKFTFELGNAKVLSHTFDLVVGARTANFKGDSSDFKDIHQNGPKPKDIQVPDFMGLGFPVPGAGWSELEYQRYLNSKVEGSMNIKDDGFNTYAGAFVSRNSKAEVLQFTETRISKIAQGADLGVIKNNGKLGILSCSASVLSETVIFEVTKESKIQFRLVMSDLYLGATGGTDRAAVVETFVRLGKGNDVGKNVIVGDEKPKSIRIADGKLAVKPPILVIDKTVVLKEGQYWYNFTSKGGVGANCKVKPVP